MADRFTRADDERVLEILFSADVHGNAATRARFGMTNSAVQGLRGRTVRAAEAIPCACRLPENRDGGMAPRWWAR